MSVRTYSTSVRVGNWNEDIQLEEVLFVYILYGSIESSPIQWMYLWFKLGLSRTLLFQDSSKWNKFIVYLIVLSCRKPISPGICILICFVRLLSPHIFVYQIQKLKTSNHFYSSQFFFFKSTFWFTINGSKLLIYFQNLTDENIKLPLSCVSSYR